MKNKETFTLKELNEAIQDKPPTTLRARVYDNVGTLFQRIGRGVYAIIDNKDGEVFAFNGDGRDLSMLEDDSIDAIITDHPYEDRKSLKGGSRNFADYDLFLYEQRDFDEKARVLKDGAFLVEFFAEENANNYEYIYECKKMAEKAGLKYYATVPWQKGTFVANTGRKAKNMEQVVIFAKGEPRRLRPDKQRGGIMRGTAGMLPAVFDFQPRPVKQKLHKAEKPVELLKEIIEYITKPGEYILDQFAGSGNLGIAAIKTGRFAMLIEKSKEIYSRMLANLSYHTATLTV
jgi:site-specific DNA-methyltransferase (adenine-specific)